MHRSKGSEAEQTAASIFPLPFTPFEYYYYSDDSPEYPTVFPFNLRFTGVLDRGHFQTALETIVARHPMIRALVDDSRRWPRWIAVDDPPQVDWADESVPIAHPTGEYIDLRTSPGLRTWVRTSPDGAHVLFAFHHACCDGLSAMQVVMEFLASYKLAAGEDDGRSGLHELDAQLLRHRGDLIGEHEPKPSLPATVRDGYRAAKIWSPILFRPPEVLAPPARSGDAGDCGPREMYSCATHLLSPDETAALQRIATSLEASVNDVLLRDFVLVLREWNRRNGQPSRARLRINVPVNVRRREEANMPAANRIGFGFVTVEPTAGDDPQRLLEVVRGETGRIKQWKLALYFLGGLAFASGVPGLLRWALARDRSLATGVLSNVGRFMPQRSLPRDERWRSGDLVLESVAGVPPIRRLTRVALIVSEYGGETLFCLRCDPRLFNARETREVLDAFIAAVRETLSRGR